MDEKFSDAELEGYLDEGLPAEAMARIEDALRGDQALVRRLSGINARRDAGIHSLGEIWRRHRLTCATRSELGAFVLGVLPDDHHAYLEFHLQTAGCRYCQANLEDLKTQQSEATEGAATRRKKYFQSSAGYLKRDK